MDGGESFDPDANAAISVHPHRRTRNDTPGAPHADRARRAAMDAAPRGYHSGDEEAMFEAAFAHGTRIGLVATFAPSVASMSEEFDAAALLDGRRPTFATVLAEEAMEALQRGDGGRHDALIADATAGLENVDAIMLGRFSMARARDAVRSSLDVPALASPDAAVAKLRSRLNT